MHGSFIIGIDVDWF